MIWNEHVKLSSTLIISPALLNSVTNYLYLHHLYQERPWLDGINFWLGRSCIPHELATFLHITGLPKPQQSDFMFAVTAPRFQIGDQNGGGCHR
ncbi:hypothetical protein YC2023_007613 [Brassica napus]